MKYAILHPAALLLPLALLTGCARTPDMTPVWQETLPGSGAKATLSNCTLQDEREVDYRLYFRYCRAEDRCHRPDPGSHRRQR